MANECKMPKIQKDNSGIMEGWNDGIMGRMKTTERRITQYSNIPFFHSSLVFFAI
jgi:hypothetical protein